MASGSGSLAKTSPGLMALAATTLFLLLWQISVVLKGPAHVPEAASGPVPPGPRARAADPGRSESRPATPESYASRLAEGLTDRQIRWITEDFRSAGLDMELGADSSEKYISRRSAQHRWYLDALADGFHLLPEQRKEAADSLAVLFEKARRDFHQAIESGPKPFEHEGKFYRILIPATNDHLTRASTWLTDDGYAPWKLCRLTPGQLAISWHDQVMERRNAPEGNLHRDPECHWSDFGKCWKIAKHDWGGAPGTIKNFTENAGKVFPFAPSQRIAEGDFYKSRTPQGQLAQLRALHPAQFRMLLLMEPSLAATIAGWTDG